MTVAEVREAVVIIHRADHEHIRGRGVEHGLDVDVHVTGACARFQRADRHTVGRVGRVRQGARSTVRRRYCTPQSSGWRTALVQ